MAESNDSVPSLFIVMPSAAAEPDEFTPTALLMAERTELSKLVAVGSPRSA